MWIDIDFYQRASSTHLRHIANNSRVVMNDPIPTSAKPLMATTPLSDKNRKTGTCIVTYTSPYLRIQRGKETGRRIAVVWLVQETAVL